jgi:hypothetical protein
MISLLLLLNQITSHYVQVHRKQTQASSYVIIEQGTGIVRAQAIECQGCCDFPGGSRRKNMGLEDKAGESAEVTTNKLFNRNV